MKFLVAVVVLFVAVPVIADEPNRILVTFLDPGVGNAARAGAPRPGYNKRNASYLVSVGVRRAATRLAREFELEFVDEWPIVSLKVHCIVYAVPEGARVDDLLKELAGRPEVESAQPLNQFEVSGTPVSNEAGSYADLQHSLAILDLASAHSISRGGGTSVTIIDTGADYNHPDLENQIRVRHDFTDADDFASDAHGTAIAGVIGAAAGDGWGVTGVAPDAELTLLRACWYIDNSESAVCDSFTLAKALDHVLNSDADVINLSLAGPHDPLLARLIKLAIDNGIVVVAAAANRPGFPATVPGVFVVAPTSSDLAPANTLLAPGDEILVPVPGGGFDFASGSSLSAAHVSGVIALLIAERPEIQRDDLALLLAASSEKSGESVNACQALAALLNRDGCRKNIAENVSAH